MSRRRRRAAIAADADPATLAFRLLNNDDTGGHAAGPLPACGGRVPCRAGGRGAIPLPLRHPLADDARRRNHAGETMEQALLERLEDGVLTLTMNRPERLNALSPDMLARLGEALARAQADAAVGVVVLAGAGRAFCAGGDVKAMAEGGRSLGFEERAQGLRQRMEVARLLHDIAKPTIAMLRGATAGAGMSLALACDLRLASDTLKFTTAFAKVGLSGDFGGSWFLTRLVGPAKARELYFTSPVLSAAEALALGIVSRVVPDAELEGETRRLAESLARGPRVALGYIKQNMNLAERASLAEAMDAEAMRHTRCAQTEDHREAAQAFVEKRPAVFRGR